MGGSGSGFIYGYCDAHYKPNMTFEEAKSFCISAVSLAMKRDGSSGGIIRLANITEKGIEKEYHTYESLPYKSFWPYYDDLWILYNWVVSSDNKINIKKIKYIIIKM